MADTSIQRQLSEVGKERARQVEKWGDRARPAYLLGLIAAEESAEVARAILAGNKAEIIKESTQAAAVYVQTMQSMKRQLDGAPATTDYNHINPTQAEYALDMVEAAGDYCKALLENDQERQFNALNRLVDCIVEKL